LARHKHVVLDFDNGEIIGLALPAESAPAPIPEFEDFRRNITLIGVMDGANQDFYLPGGEKFLISPFSEMVYRNGVAQSRGASDDYTITETGGAGTGYDKVTFAVAPLSWEHLTIDYIKKV
jgi:hypothetical protein